jgi:4-amino-4-deoxy-L-arabinose transferase-like glycosyltransferase
VSTGAGTTAAHERRDRGWVRSVVLVFLAGLAGLSYGWAASRDPLEPYYAAAVRSMSASWHNFAFGAFDPAGTITLDKLPGAFWVQALSVRAFGFHTWAVVAPQAVEGVLTVLVLYLAVRRLAGPTAGLIAAAIVVVSPATVALNRGNISDSLMILLLVLAADAVSRAIANGNQRWLVLGAVWVGLAFQTKMIEAWMVLPAFGLTYVISAPGTRLRRIRHLAVAGAVVGLVSVSWMTAVSLVEPSSRPYVDGSHHDSVYEQVFVYNGFGRFGDQTPLQLLDKSLGTAIAANPTAVAPNRLLRGDLGRDIGWLLPAALIIAIWGIASRRRQPRGDPLRASFVLWGGWLATLAVVFSLTTTINNYYTAALTPAIAALIGTGIAAARTAEGSTVGRRVGLAILTAGTITYAAWLVGTGSTDAPDWLIPAIIVLGVAAALAALTTRNDARFAVALVAGLAAGCFAPAVAASELVAHHEGAFDTPFESAGEREGLDYLFLQIPAHVKTTIPLLKRVQNGAPYLLATQTSALAAAIILDSGLEVLPIGGFTGTSPSPTLPQLEADIRHGRMHLVLIATNADPRMRWIITHCPHTGDATPTVHNYYCEPSNAP